MRKFLVSSSAQRHTSSFALEAAEVAIDEAAKIEDPKEQKEAVANATADADAVASDKLVEAAPLPEVVTESLQECIRMEAISDALEDLAVIADGIAEPDANDLALVRSVADMAVAGTDVQSEEIISEEVVPLEVEVAGEFVPATEPGPTGATLPQDIAPEEIVLAQEAFKARKIATEAFVGKRIATETIRETARNIWEAIKKFLKEIWAKIEKFFYNIFGTIPMLRRKVEGLKKRIETVSEEGKRPGKEKLTINTSVSSLSVNNKPCDTEAKLGTAVSDLTDQAKRIFGSYVDVISAQGGKIAKVISDFDPKAPAKSVDEMVKVLNNNGIEAMDNVFKNSGGNRYPDYMCKTSDHLLGNVVLLSKIKKGAESKSASITALDAARTARIELATSSENGSEGPKDFQITAFSTSGMNSLLDKSVKLLDVLEEFKRGSKYGKINTAKKEIETASSKAESALGKLKDDESKPIPEYRALLNFNKAYAAWASSPTMSFYRHAIASINAVNSIIAKSLSGYKASDSKD